MSNSSTVITQNIILLDQNYNQTSWFETQTEINKLMLTSTRFMVLKETHRISFRSIRNENQLKAAT